jgi:hypothetical protein
MKTTTIIIAVLCLALLTIGGVYAYNQIEKNIYTKGFNDAGLYINQQIVSNLLEQGFINVIVPYNNTEGEQEVYQVKLGVVNSTRVK